MITDKQIRKVLKDKKKSSTISCELGISDRVWRSVVKDYNSQFDTREYLNGTLFLNY